MSTNCKTPIQGIVLMVCANLAFGVMSAMVRHASYIHSSKVALFRFVIGMGLLGTAALLGRIKLTFHNHLLLFLRGLLGGAVIFLFYVSITKLGVGKGTVLIYTFPVFASLGSALFLGERIGPGKWGAIAASLIGIFLLTFQPGAGLAFIGPYEILAVCGAMMSGTAVVCIKKLHDTESSYSIFFAQCVIGFWLMIIPANLIPSAGGYSASVLLLVIGITAASGQLLMTAAYKRVSVSTGALMGMLLPVINLGTGILLFQEVFSARGLVGALIVVCSCIAVLAKDVRQ